MANLKIVLQTIIQVYPFHTELIYLCTGSQYRFAILQQMISDYLQNDFDCNKCDDLSAEIMDLLYALISFGFYYSFDHLYDITVPLIQVYRL